MKTTVDLADELASLLKKRTAREGISMREALHQAIRLWLKTPSASSMNQHISPHVGLMQGRGLTQEAAPLSWDE